MTHNIVSFKSNLPSITVLALGSQDLELIKERLQQKIKQAPMMFIGMQVIIDLSALEADAQFVLEASALLKYLQGEGINPVAFMTDKQSFRSVLLEQGMGVLPVIKSQPGRSGASSASVGQNTTSIQELPKPQTNSEEPKKTFAEDVRRAKSDESTVIRHPVRSGQRIYCRGDLTVIGSVSPGAEVIADGNIHIYGKLSGRAVAGAQGNSDAMIFCQKLNAELVAIAGNYKQLEEINAEFQGACVQVLLRDEKIDFLPLQ